MGMVRALLRIEPERMKILVNKGSVPRPISTPVLPALCHWVGKDDSVAVRKIGKSRYDTNKNAYFARSWNRSATE
jgi:hypothetical protein